MPFDPFLSWALTQVAAPEVVSRGIDAIAKRDWRHKLASAAADQSGGLVSRRQLQVFLDRTDVWAELVDGPIWNQAILVDILRNTIEENPRTLGSQAELSVTDLQIVIGYLRALFLTELDPSLAVAVSDYRTQSGLARIESLLSGFLESGNRERTTESQDWPKGASVMSGFSPVFPKPNLYGVEPYLTELDELVANRRTRLVGIVGPAGTGKTQILAKWLTQALSDFDFAIWTDGSTDLQPQITWADDQLSNYSTSDSPRTLLVIDGLPGVDSLTMVSSLPNASVIVVTTTDPRMRDISNNVVGVRVMDPSVASAFLTESTNEEPDADGVAELAKELGYVPLFLAHAVAWCRANSSSPSAYLQELKTSGDLKGSGSTSAYDDQVNRTWQLSLTSASANDEIVARIFYAIVVSGGSIQDRLLGGFPNIPYTSLSTNAKLIGTIGARTRLDQLAKFGLVELLDNGEARIHTLVQRSAREKILDSAIGYQSLVDLSLSIWQCESANWGKGLTGTIYLTNGLQFVTNYIDRGDEECNVDSLPSSDVRAVLMNIYFRMYVAYRPMVFGRRAFASSMVRFGRGQSALTIALSLIAVNHSICVAGTTGLHDLSIGEELSDVGPADGSGIHIPAKVLAESGDAELSRMTLELYSEGAFLSSLNDDDLDTTIALLEASAQFLDHDGDLSRWPDLLLNTLILLVRSDIDLPAAYKFENSERSFAEEITRRLGIPKGADITQWMIENPVENFDCSDARAVLMSQHLEALLSDDRIDDAAEVAQANESALRFFRIPGRRPYIHICLAKLWIAKEDHQRADEWISSALRLVSSLQGEQSQLGANVRELCAALQSQPPKH